MVFLWNLTQTAKTFHKNLDLNLKLQNWNLNLLLLPSPFVRRGIMREVAVFVIGGHGQSGKSQSVHAIIDAFELETYVCPI